MSFNTPDQQLRFNSKQNLRALQDEIKQAMLKYESKEDIVVLTNIEIKYNEIARSAVLKELGKSGWQVWKGTVNLPIVTGFATHWCWVISSKELTKISSDKVLQHLGVSYFNWQLQE